MAPAIPAGQAHSAQPPQASLSAASPPLNLTAALLSISAPHRWGRESFLSLQGALHTTELFKWMLYREEQFSLVKTQMWDRAFTFYNAKWWVFVLLGIVYWEYWKSCWTAKEFSHFSKTHIYCHLLSKKCMLTLYLIVCIFLSNGIIYIAVRTI